MKRNVITHALTVLLTGVLITGTAPFAMASPTNEDSNLATASAEYGQEQETPDAEISTEPVDSLELCSQSGKLTSGWTQSGTCEWKVDSKGLLTIRPLGNGDSGVLADWTSDYEPSPWSMNESIKSVKVEKGVQAATCESMFNGCSNLFTADLSNLDVSNVWNMSWMFSGCSSLGSINISGFDTSNVETMESMFEGCSSIPSVDLSGFDTSQLSNMGWMFYGCSNMAYVDVSSFNTSQVTDMEWLFMNCTSLVALDISNFDMSQVEVTGEMLSNCPSLASIVLPGGADFSESLLKEATWEDSQGNFYETTDDMLEANKSRAAGPETYDVVTQASNQNQNTDADSDNSSAASTTDSTSTNSNSSTGTTAASYSSSSSPSTGDFTGYLAAALSLIACMAAIVLAFSLIRSRRISD